MYQLAVNVVKKKQEYHNEKKFMHCNVDTAIDQRSESQRSKINRFQKQTWENFKSKERRRSAMLKPEPDTETGTGAGKQEPPSEPASQKPLPVLKNGRPKFMKTKTMTLGSFDS